MSAVEAAIEKVKLLNEESALNLLEWLRTQEQIPIQKKAPRGAEAMIGFARRFHAEQKSTDQWMAELREGEKV